MCSNRTNNYSINSKSRKSKIANYLFKENNGNHLMEWDKHYPPEKSLLNILELAIVYDEERCLASTDKL